LRRSGRDVAIAAKVTVLGVEVRPSAQAQVSVDGGAPHLILGDVHLDGFGVPSAAVDAAVLVITTVLDRALELPTLPYGLQLTSVIAASSGIRINAAAADVIL
jgi:hypothetical protein